MSVEDSHYYCLEDWFLHKNRRNGKIDVDYKVTVSKSIRLELPLSEKIDAGCVLSGWLTKKKVIEDDSCSVSMKKNEKCRKFVNLTNLDHVIFNPDPKHRGLWIVVHDSSQSITNHGNCSTHVENDKQLYWLHRPCFHNPFKDTPSQNDLHQKHRLAVAVASCLYDCFFSRSDAVKFARLSVENVIFHTRLNIVFGRVSSDKNKSFDDDDSSCDKVSDNKLELKLLIHCKDILAECLKYTNSWLTNTCPFIESIRNLHQSTDWVKDSLEQKIHTIETKLGQCPWGERNIHNTSNQCIAPKIDRNDRENENILGDESAKPPAVNSRCSAAIQIDNLLLPGVEFEHAADAHLKRHNTGVGVVHVKRIRMSKDEIYSTPKAEIPAYKLKSKKPLISDSMCYSQDRMWNALADNRIYLDPKPCGSHRFGWIDVKSKRYAVADEKQAEEMFSKVGDWQIDVLPLESVLLVIEAVKNSCLQGMDKVIKLFLFAGTGPMTMKRAATVVFNDSIDRSLRILEAQLKLQECIENSVAFFLVQSVLEFIIKCRVISDQKHMSALKRKGVDWEALIQKVGNGFLKKRSVGEFAKVYYNAQQKVLKAMNTNRTPVVKTSTLSSLVDAKKKTLKNITAPTAETTLPDDNEVVSNFAPTSRIPKKNQDSSHRLHPCDLGIVESPVGKTHSEKAFGHVKGSWRDRKYEWSEASSTSPFYTESKCATNDAVKVMGSWKHRNATLPVTLGKGPELLEKGKPILQGCWRDQKKPSGSAPGNIGELSRNCTVKGSWKDKNIGSRTEGSDGELLRNATLPNGGWRDQDLPSTSARGNTGEVSRICTVKGSWKNKTVGSKTEGSTGGLLRNAVLPIAIEKGDDLVEKGNLTLQGSWRDQNLPPTSTRGNSGGVSRICTVTGSWKDKTVGSRSVGSTGELLRNATLPSTIGKGDNLVEKRNPTLQSSWRDQNLPPTSVRGNSGGVSRICTVKGSWKDKKVVSRTEGCNNKVLQKQTERENVNDQKVPSTIAPEKDFTVIGSWKKRAGLASTASPGISGSLVQTKTVQENLKDAPFHAPGHLSALHGALSVRGSWKDRTMTAVAPTPAGTTGDVPAMGKTQVPIHKQALEPATKRDNPGELLDIDALKDTSNHKVHSSSDEGNISISLDERIEIVGVKKQNVLSASTIGESPEKMTVKIRGSWKNKIHSSASGVKPVIPEGLVHDYDKDTSTSFASIHVDNSLPQCETLSRRQFLMTADDSSDGEEYIRVGSKDADFEDKAAVRETGCNLPCRGYMINRQH